MPPKCKQVKRNTQVEPGDYSSIIAASAEGSGKGKCVGYDHWGDLYLYGCTGRQEQMFDLDSQGMLIAQGGRYAGQCLLADGWFWPKFRPCDDSDSRQKWKYSFGKLTTGTNGNNMCLRFDPTWTSYMRLKVEECNDDYDRIWTMNGLQEFDPSSTLTSYIDHGGCGPRGDDAQADLSQCTNGFEVDYDERLDNWKVVATVNGCDYFEYIVYKCSPTPSPTASPSHTPSSLPTVNPTASSSHVPTSAPTDSPSNGPSSLPTMKPSVSPSHVPTSDPSDSPSSVPTSYPTVNPTASPSHIPTSDPSDSPSNVPTSHPTMKPSVSPSHVPTSPLYAKIQGENYNDQRGIISGGNFIGWFDSGDYLTYKGLNFGPSGTTKRILFRYSKGKDDGKLELRIGGPSGTLIGEHSFANTYGWNTYREVYVQIDDVVGINDLTLVGVGSYGILNIDWFQLSA